MKNKILFGDCLDLMPSIESKSIDMILCDLPYQVTNNKWDQMIPLDSLWEEYVRIIKDNGAIVLTAVQPFASMLISSNMKMFRYDLIWEKNKVTGFLNSKRMPLRKHEHILVFYNKKPIYNPQKTQGHKPVNSFTNRDGTTYGKTKSRFSGGGQTDRYPTSVLKFSVVNNDSKEKIHPSQKPVELFEWLIKTYTNEGDLVLDNCVGSGTTAIACLNCSRNFVVMESDLEYFKLAEKRIKSYA